MSERKTIAIIHLDEVDGHFHAAVELDTDVHSLPRTQTIGTSLLLAARTICDERDRERARLRALSMQAEQATAEALAANGVRLGSEVP